MTDTTYDDDRKRGDQKMLDVIHKLGESLIKIADDEEDQKRNTDLFQMTPSGEIIRYPVRWRFKDFSKPDVVEWFERQLKYEVTFRCHKESGEDTEWQKMWGKGSDRKEYGDYDFYGWQDINTGVIKSWVVIDLAKFRAWFRRIKPEIIFDKSDYDDNCGAMRVNGEAIGYIMRVEKEYKDGSKGFDYFYVFDWRNFPDAVVATSVEWEVT